MIYWASRAFAPRLDLISRRPTIERRGPVRPDKLRILSARILTFFDRLRHFGCSRGEIVESARCE